MQLKKRGDVYLWEKRACLWFIAFAMGIVTTQVIEANTNVKLLAHDIENTKQIDSRQSDDIADLKNIYNDVRQDLGLKEFRLCTVEEKVGIKPAGGKL